MQSRGFCLLKACEGQEDSQLNYTSIRSRWITFYLCGILLPTEQPKAKKNIMFIYVYNIYIYIYLNMFVDVGSTMITRYF